ncbi:MAG: hypothetical protein AAF467_26195 [Actinomycetota bacterium]
MSSRWSRNCTPDDAVVAVVGAGVVGAAVVLVVAVVCVVVGVVVVARCVVGAEDVGAAVVVVVVVVLVVAVLVEDELDRAGASFEAIRRSAFAADVVGGPGTTRPLDASATSDVELDEEISRAVVDVVDDDGDDALADVEVVDSTISPEFEQAATAIITKIVAAVNLTAHTLCAMQGHASRAGR